VEENVEMPDTDGPPSSFSLVSFETLILDISYRPP